MNALEYRVLESMKSRLVFRKLTLRFSVKFRRVHVNRAFKTDHTNDIISVWLEIQKRYIRFRPTGTVHLKPFFCLCKEGVMALTILEMETNSLPLSLNIAIQMFHRGKPSSIRMQGNWCISSVEVWQ